LVLFSRFDHHSLAAPLPICGFASVPLFVWWSSGSHSPRLNLKQGSNSTLRFAERRVIVFDNEPKASISCSGLVEARVTRGLGCQMVRLGGNFFFSRKIMIRTLRPIVLFAILSRANVTLDYDNSTA
jgi:hypothetical protein